MAEIEVTFSDRIRSRKDLNLKEIEDIICKAALSALEVEGEDGILSVLVMDDDEIKELNRTYLNVDRPTDVLAFSMIEGEEIQSGMGRILGDVVISVDTAKRQAEEYGNTFQDEVALLVIHGVLHILGYDDQDKEGAALMRRKEAESLIRFGRR